MTCRGPSIRGPSWLKSAINQILSIFDQDETDADADDDDFDESDPGAIEQIRLEFAAIEDTEQLSLAFLDRERWHFTELHDELRRACSGSGKISRYLARQTGFEFIVGVAASPAYRGNGPLSTPLNFVSMYPEAPAWNEEVISLNELSRQDALKLGANLSFMMH
jgi:hypothetical protein